jgi:hypothetical protein
MSFILAFDFSSLVIVLTVLLSFAHRSQNSVRSFGDEKDFDVRFSFRFRFIN